MPVTLMPAVPVHVNKGLTPNCRDYNLKVYAVYFIAEKHMHRRSYYEKFVPSTECGFVLVKEIGEE